VLRPLWVDLLLTLLPLALAIAAWVAGRYWARMPRELAVPLIILALLIVPLPLLRFVPGWRDFAGVLLHSFGGATRLECGAALFLLGIASAAPRKSLSPAFLGTVAGLVGLVMLTESAGRLWWRFMAPATWNNVPNANGCITQTTGSTCSSAATAMLLHHHGIRASEGELAYLSNTSLLGTTSLDMADALRAQLETGWFRQTGWFRPVVERIPYDKLVSKHWAFVADVDLPNIGGHAVFVRLATAQVVELVDPRDGTLQQMPRREFERIWEGTALLIVSEYEVGEVDTPWRKVRE
jgi:hypothetical protein